MSTFASFYRGTAVPAAAASSTGGFEHAYRGSFGVPVVPASGPEAAESVGGGLTAGGAAAARLDLAAVGGGGFSTGGGATIPADLAVGGSFGYWRRGASISDTAAGSSGGFGYARRGSTAVPVVAVGGPVVATPAAAAGGVPLGGSASVEAALLGAAGGGLGLSGRGLAAVATVAAGSGGAAAGGGSTASVSAAVAASGGAAFGGSGFPLEVGYHVYMNDGQGGPIDYSTAVATTYDASWTSAPLPAPGSYRFGVRAFGASSGLEERNIDAAVELVLDADGDDATWKPLPPIGARATPLSGGRARVEWSAVATDLRRLARGFRVYARPASEADFGGPIAVVPYALDRSGSYAAEIDGLVDSTVYVISVRAWNAWGESNSDSLVSVIADSTAPSPIDSLQASPISGRE